MTRDERRLLGEILHEMRQFNPYHVVSPQVQHWAAVLATVLKSHAQPPSNPCAMCGAAARWQRRPDIYGTKDN